MPNHALRVSPGGPAVQGVVKDTEGSTQVNATPIRSEDGGVESFVVTLQDLTPLEELERLRAEFLGMVSHELRTPLATIKGSVGPPCLAARRTWTPP